MGYFSASTQAQSATNVPLRPYPTLEMCNSDVSKNSDYQIILCNDTPRVLTLVGTYKVFGDSWRLGDVPANNVQYIDYKPGGAGFFSYAANYAIGDTGKYLQIAVSNPPVGKKKISICIEQAGGNKPAENCSDNMTNSFFKNVNFERFSAQADMPGVGGKTQWLFRVR